MMLGRRIFFNCIWNPVRLGLLLENLQGEQRLRLFLVLRDKKMMKTDWKNLQFAIPVFYCGTSNEYLFDGQRNPHLFD